MTKHQKYHAANKEKRNADCRLYQRLNAKKIKIRKAAARIMNREALRIYQAGWRLSNRKKYNAHHVAYQLKKQEALAGRTRPEFCEICYNSGKIVFDHCHDTGEFRGWLCNECNVALGCVKDDPGRLRLLADYLEKQSK